MIDMAKLKARHEEELKDVEMYHAMAKECPEFECIFYDIAAEEQEHADMIKHIMEHS